MESTLCTKSVNIFYMEEETELVRLINAEIRKRNLGLREAAKIIGTSHPTLGRALAGGAITYEFGVQIARFLHLPPEQVFRTAGLLPPAPRNTEQHQQLLYLFDQMSPEKRVDLLSFAEFLIKRN